MLKWENVLFFLSDEGPALFWICRQTFSNDVINVTFIRFGHFFGGFFSKKQILFFLGVFLASAFCPFFSLFLSCSMIMLIVTQGRCCLDFVMRLWMDSPINLV